MHQQVKVIDAFTIFGHYTISVFAKKIIYLPAADNLDIIFSLIPFPLYSEQP
jgi:hypothetical protein